MIAYLDTSALIPLIIREPGTAHALEVWRTADALAASRLIVVESAAAIAAAVRAGRVSEEQADDLRGEADRLTRELYLLDVTTEVIDAAAALTAAVPLRGYDAVHLASTESLARDAVVVASGDAALLSTARARGLHTVDTSGRAEPPARP